MRSPLVVFNKLETKHCLLHYFHNKFLTSNLLPELRYFFRAFQTASRPFVHSYTQPDFYVKFQQMFVFPGAGWQQSQPLRNKSLRIYEFAFMTWMRPPRCAHFNSTLISVISTRPVAERAELLVFIRRSFCTRTPKPTLLRFLVSCMQRKPRNV